ncbi:SDR family oxidoreductase [Candidatus Micrarchaeota archaeon]|nr:SDR family oxidoreductase [Candidatus Micrarchaeota archaeon]
MKLLDGKVAIVTGGGRGIGAAIAMEFAKNGAKVVLAGRVPAELEETAKKIKAAGGEALAAHADVTKLKDIRDMLGKTSKAFGKIDILVNNAGVLLDYGPFADMKDENMQKTVDVNLLGTMHCTKEAIPYLKKNRSGLIINISSVAGKSGYPNLAVYSATKFGIIGFTESLAQELEKDRIAVYAICPTGTQTKMFEQISTAKAEHVPEDVALEIMDLIKNMKKIPTGKAIDVGKHV